ncbi:tyrosine-protein phosphatase non-receptor type 1-like isoform X2 [Pecten maximus]|uniref:tyrosine-protein phosphatase non-receptor type 1-like isoform X2 n=1 Tax=Pecten maximus TaxID=6579 RepID=UPI0014586D5D|nr:tyrosine-protein phosphatase non-receptor type 1-like isoform X2 [Pecten maximus]
MQSTVEKEFAQYDQHNLWQPIYQEVKNEAAERAIDEDFSTSEAKKPVNRNKNRYRDVSPYDHSRVVLHRGDTDYINASLIEVTEANRHYILAQGPLEHTSGHFWQMVWEHKSKAVIMLNKLVENGYKKCHPYFPQSGLEEEIEYEEVGLKVSLLDESYLNYYIVRKIELEEIESGDTREVLHYNYITWPDFGVPSSPHVFLNFLMVVRETGSLDADVGPPVVHCSAGIGRSGTFCLVDSCLVIVEKSQDLNSVNLRQLLLKMRTCRMGLIQTADQLRFSYMAIIEGGHRILANDDSTLSVLEGYMQDKSVLPPPPPTRTTSLSPSHGHRGEAPPPLPPRTGLPMDMADGLDKSQDFELSDSDSLVDEDDDDNEDLSESEAEDEDDFVDMRNLQPEKREDRVNCIDEDIRTEPPHEEIIHTEDQNNTSGYEIRRRNREERSKKTREQVEKMRQKQKDNDMRKSRRSYFQPVAIGLSILLGGLLIYRYYWSSY